MFRKDKNSAYNLNKKLGKHGPSWPQKKEEKKKKRKQSDKRMVFTIYFNYIHSFSAIFVLKSDY